MTTAQRDLYHFPRAKVHQPQLPMNGRYPMPAGWRERVIISEEAAE